MEAYESKCQDCGHTWYWTGLKTGIGYPEMYKAQFERNSKCPRCGGSAKTGLDHTSENGKMLDESMSVLVDTIKDHLLPKS